jgi:NADH dehydrogenase FAD-containing subunit
MGLVCGSALAQIAVDKKFIKTSGEAGFYLWRSVYLSKQVSWRNRVLVAVDWVKTRVFGRDITRTSL